jgi:hypothetical protein
MKALFKLTILSLISSPFFEAAICASALFEYSLAA